jgi:transposase
MPAKKYKVALSAAERQTLQQLTTTGKAAAYKITRARILLKADEHQAEGGWKDHAISEALDVSVATIERVRQQFVEEGSEAVLRYKQRQGSSTRRLDGAKEAHLSALTCSDAPEGRARWTLRLLVDRMIEVGHVEQISHETIRQTLKKTS